LFSGCVWSEAELGDDYYWLPKYEAIDVGYPNSEAIVYKSYDRWVFKDIKINGDVVKINSDSKHIIAKRKLNNTEKFEFYIIDKKLDSVIGPSDYKTFLEVKDKLKIDLAL
tara:strand:+ start:622 stop:954 length:333 start_codon:yes stop_codon:yes gene_type:complete